MGRAARPVRAIAFDKTHANNWALGWHQDRTICVGQRSDVHGYGPWTKKQGMDHVEPPFSLLERMLTIRIHLDEVGPDNAPLTIASGSHRHGRVKDEDVCGIVTNSEIAQCLANPGDVWVYATPVLHASAASTSKLGPRVLQLNYCADSLAHPLEWASNLT